MHTTISPSANINYNQFIQIEKDMDYEKYERSFSGRMTKERFKRLQSFCRRFSFSEPYCGHEYDCCGCLLSQTVTMTYKQNCVTITLARSFNY